MSLRTLSTSVLLCLLLSLAFLANSKAASAEDAKTQYTDAMKAMNDGADSDYPAYVLRGIALLTKSAEQGYAPAQFKLGYYFHTGPLSWDCLVQDPEKAYYWYGKAAEQDHLEAQYELAMLYNAETGFDRFANRAKYVAWMSKAAELGYAKAQRQLGRMYQTGDAVPVDPDLARRWTERAAAQARKRPAGGASTASGQR